MIRGALVGVLVALVVVPGTLRAAEQAAAAPAAKRPTAKIASRTATVDASRKVALLMRCNRSGRACRGKVVLRPKGEKRKVGKKSFRIRSGRAKVVIVRLSRAGYARLLAAERLKVRATASTRRIQAKSKRKGRIIVLLTPGLTVAPIPSPLPGPSPNPSPAPAPGPGPGPGPGGDPPPPNPSDDQARADRIALKLSDLPAGWTVAGDDGGAGPECSVVPDGISGWHELDQFETGLATSAGSEVAVFTSVAEAITAHSTVPGEINKCFEDSVGQTFDGVTINDVRVTKLPSPGVGDRSSAYRIELDVTADGLDLTSYVDVVYIQRERVGTSLVFTEILSPIDPALKNPLVGKIAGRMAP